MLGWKLEIISWKQQNPTPSPRLCPLLVPRPHSANHGQTWLSPVLVPKPLLVHGWLSLSHDLPLAPESRASPEKREWTALRRLPPALPLFWIKTEAKSIKWEWLGWESKQKSETKLASQSLRESRLVSLVTFGLGRVWILGDPWDCLIEPCCHAH